MLVRIQAAQQAQTANPANQQTTERPERPEQPARPEVGYPSGAQGRELRDQIRQTIRAAQEAAADARNAQREANQVRIQNGMPVIAPVPPIPHIQVNTGFPGDVIPPQAVDISIAFFVMCAVMVIGWPLARAFGRRLERSGQTAAVSPAVAEQLQRIEQAVEAMSIEVERISESQRFLAKLQTTARSEPAALESGDRR